MNVRDVLSAEASDAVFVAMQRALENDTVEVVNYTLQWDDDPLRHLEARIVRSGDDEAVAIVRDITPQKLQEQALEALAEGRAALSRVAVAVAKAERPGSGLRRRDRGGRAAARRRRREPRPLRGPRAADEGVIVGKWSEPGIPIAEVGTVDPGRPRPARAHPADRASRRGAARTTPTCPRASPHG